MKIETTIKYYEGYIPPRCRKTRYNEVTEIVSRTIKETSFDNLKLAFIDLTRNLEHYLYNGKIYKKVEFNSNIAFDDTITNAIDDLKAWRKKGSTYFASEYETKKDILRRLNKEMKSYLIVDNVLYVEEPRIPIINIMTFGLGHNHGGTGIFIDYTTRPKSLKKTRPNYYFFINEWEKAKERAIEVALKRGDYKYVEYVSRPLIDIKIPELFK
jgi:hypothetical protein